MDNKPKKKAIKPVDPQGDVLNSLSAAVRASEHALNVASSAIASSNLLQSTGIYNAPGNQWIIPGTMSPYTVPPNVAAPPSYNTVASNTLNLQQYDTSNFYPKVDIERIFAITKANPYDCVPQKADGSIPSENASYEVKIYLAGVDKNRIEINLSKSSGPSILFSQPRMTINILAAKRKLEEAKLRNFVLKESKDSFVTRCIVLPEDTDIEVPIKAKMKDGILTFRLSILEPQVYPEPSSYKIDIT